ncbi:hypothetical protein BD311DRAFT_663717 [Dichomitus squalens]|uniref:SUN domain-containing protein n=1 Tax=Dichomitus squalens TaxID=114155 RepID=A0A4Q9MQ17_9APHY|nr:hypothetical protein BD311DRAFT_663717 [Dichomitus squalens]
MVPSHRVVSQVLPDYALKANGGRVLMSLTSVSGGLFASRDDDPALAIDDDVHAGRCWRSRALPSQLGIRLSRILRPSHVSIEHAPAEVVMDVGQAPKNLTLWGLVDGMTNVALFQGLLRSYPMDHPARRAPEIAKSFLWAPLTSFSYDIYSEHVVQTFPIALLFIDSGMSFGIVVLEILDNWGGDATCLYRVRVHGTEV